MAWEHRDGRRYYYRARKVNGRTVKEYVGKGEIGELCAQMDELKRQWAEHDRIVKRGEWADLTEGLTEVEAAVSALCRRNGAIVAAALTAAGYHQHKRGEWRKRRMTTERAITAPGVDPAAADGYIPTDPAEQRELVRSAAVPGRQNPDPAKEARALACLEAYPNEHVWSTGNCVNAVLEMVAYSPVHREIIVQDTRAKRRELAGPNPSPLETLLIDRILACWLSVAFYEQQAAATTVKPEGIKPELSDFLQRRIDTAQRRYLEAIKALAQVRRLEIPINVQVNLAADGGQQVNVGTLSTGGPNA